MKLDSPSMTTPSATSQARVDTSRADDSALVERETQLGGEVAPSPVPVSLEWVKTPPNGATSVYEDPQKALLREQLQQSQEGATESALTGKKSAAEAISHYDFYRTLHQKGVAVPGAILAEIHGPPRDADAVTDRICPKCLANRSKETCKGDRMHCLMDGTYVQGVVPP